MVVVQWAWGPVSGQLEARDSDGDKLPGRGRGIKAVGTYSAWPARHRLRAQKAFDELRASTSSREMAKGLSMCIACAWSIVAAVAVAVVVVAVVGVVVIERLAEVALHRYPVRVQGRG